MEAGRSHRSSRCRRRRQPCTRTTRTCRCSRAHLCALVVGRFRAPSLGRVRERSGKVLRHATRVPAPQEVHHCRRGRLRRRKLVGSNFAARSTGVLCNSVQFISLEIVVIRCTQRSFKRATLGRSACGRRRCCPWTPLTGSGRCATERDRRCSGWSSPPSRAHG